MIAVAVEVSTCWLVCIAEFGFAALLKLILGENGAIVPAMRKLRMCSIFGCHCTLTGRFDLCSVSVLAGLPHQSHESEFTPWTHVPVYACVTCSPMMRFSQMFACVRVFTP